MMLFSLINIFNGYYNPESIKFIDASNTSPSTDYSIVQLTDETPQFQELSDKYFKISERAAIIRRKVRYCKGLGKWISPEQYLYQNDNSYKYQYPDFNILNEYYDYKAIKLGKYTLVSDFLNESLAQTLLVPSYSQLTNFVRSDAQKSFRYIGKGFFYSETQPGRSMILRRELGNDVNGKIENLNQLLNSCTPGDIYVQFYVYQPTQLTVVGKRRGTTIYPYRCTI